MNLLTEELQTQLEQMPLYGQEGLGEDAKVLVRFHAIGTSAVWYITEASKEENSNDYLLFGYCHIFESEWGYVRLSELEKTADGHRILADVSCAGKTVKECLEIYTDSRKNLTCEIFKSFLQQNLGFYLQEIMESPKVLLKTVYKDEKKLTGITVSSANSVIAPVFYVEQLYQELIHTAHCLDSYMIFLTARFRQSLEEVSQMHANSLFDDVESKLFACVVPKNSTVLANDDIYYEEFLDMAVYYRVLITQLESDERVASAVVTKSLLKSIDLESSSLRQYALNGSNELNQYELQSILDVVAVAEKVPELCEYDDVPMYLVSNKRYVYGASVLLSDYLRSIVELVGDGFYVLPSSRHEVIVLPAEAVQDEQYLRDMVSLVNLEVVLDGDRLTNSIYRYFVDRGLQQV